MEQDLSILPFSVPLRSQLLVVIGQQALSQKMLELIAGLGLKQRVTILDCGNRSNMYTVAKLIRPFTSDPVGIMNNIHLSRAFTCYQVLAMLEMVSETPPCEPLVILDLLATFLDEDVKLKDCERLLVRSIACLKKLSLFSPVLVSLRPIPAISEARSGFLEQLKVSANAYWEEPAPLTDSFGLQPVLFS